MAYTLDYYKNKKRQTENQIRDRRAQNARIQQEITQLENAYNKLGKIKRTNANNANAVRDNAKLSKVAGNVQWRGKSKKQFDDVMKNQVPSAAREFFNSIDAMQDEVGRALDRKRGEYDTGSQILNGLNRTLNNLAGIIRNWVN